MISAWLVVIGLFLIVLEFILPGMICGILGAVTLLVALFLFATDFPSPLWVTLFIVTVAFLLYGVIRFSLWRIAHSKKDGALYLRSDQKGFVASAYDKTVIGESGVVATDLKPAGFIIVQGKQLSALSVSGYIPKGEKVDIIGGEEQNLIVKKKVEKQI